MKVVTVVVAMVSSSGSASSADRRDSLSAYASNRRTGKREIPFQYSADTPQQRRNPS